MNRYSTSVAVKPDLCNFPKQHVTGEKTSCLSWAINDQFVESSAM